MHSHYKTTKSKYADLLTKVKSCIRFSTKKLITLNLFKIFYMYAYIYIHIFSNKILRFYIFDRLLKNKEKQKLRDIIKIRSFFADASGNCIESVKF